MSLKGQKKGQSWNKMASGHVYHLGCPLRTYTPKKIENLGSIPGPRKYFPKKLLLQVFLQLPEKSRKGQDRNKRAYAHLHYIGYQMVPFAKLKFEELIQLWVSQSDPRH